jgi:hypothetical protein
MSDIDSWLGSLLSYSRLRPEKFPKPFSSKFYPRLMVLNMKATLRFFPVILAIGTALVWSIQEAAAAPGAPYGYTGGTYSQNFNGLPTNVTNPSQVVTGKGPFYFMGNADISQDIIGASGMDGWQYSNPGGSSANTEFRAQDGSNGSSSGRGVQSFGINGSTNRALGALSTSNQVNTFGMLLINNTASTTFTSLTLSYTGEVWRIGDASPPDVLTFAYGLPTDTNDINSLILGGDTNLDFHGDSTSNYATIKPTVPVASGVMVDGTNSINQSSVSDTITGISWAPGQVFAIRWLGQNNTGQDDGLGIDNFSLSFSSGAGPVHGDVNGDGHFNAADIKALEQALTNGTSSGFANVADFNNDGAVTNVDLQGMLTALIAGQGSASAVPEPSAIALAGLALLSFVGVNRKRFVARCQRSTTSPVAQLAI